MNPFMVATTLAPGFIHLVKFILKTAKDIEEKPEKFLFEPEIGPDESRHQRHLPILEPR